MNHELLLGQYYPVNSWIHKLDPRSKLVGVFLLMLAFMIVGSLSSLAVLLVAALAISRLSGVPAQIYLKGMRPLLWLILFTLILPIFSTSGKPIINMGLLVITQEGLVKGFFNAIRLINILAITSVLTLTTSPLELSKGLEGLLKPLSYLGVPIQELALMMSLTMRFIPMLLEESERITAAQKARGANLGFGNVFRRTKAYIPILIPLFLGAFRRVDHLAEAMEARCYRGAAGRTKLYPLKWQNNDTVAVAVCALILALISLI